MNNEKEEQVFIILLFATCVTLVIGALMMKAKKSQTKNLNNAINKELPFKGIYAK